MRLKTTIAKIITGALATGGFVLGAAGQASAHVSIVTYGTTFKAGATNVIYFRVPHGCADTDLYNSSTNPTGTQDYNARTNQVTVEIPAAATGVKPQVIGGWTVSVTRAARQGAVTSVTWTANSATEALRDWTYGDFGIRATLGGVAGDVLQFRTTQTCDYHDDGTAATLTEVWEGANVPSLTLVSSANAVTGAADLATLRSNVNTLQTQASDALTAISGLVSGAGTLGTRVTALETSLTALSAKVQAARLGFMKVSGAGGATVTVDIDLPSIYQYQNFTLKAGTTVVAATYLGSYGDRRLTLTGAAAAKIHKGATITVVVGGTTQASTTA